MSSLINQIRDSRASSAAQDATLPQARAAAAPLPPNLPPPVACQSHGAAGLFWLNAYGAVICQACSPPPSPAMVRRLLSIDPAAGCWRDAAELAEELAEKNFGEKFPEPKLCEQCSGNIFWLDYDGKIFCNHCFQPAGPPAKFLAVCSSPARWEDARRPKLKTVAEVCQEWEEKYFAEAKKFWPEFREHFRKNFTYSSSEALESWKGDTSRASKSSKSAASRGARR